VGEGSDHVDGSSRCEYGKPEDVLRGILEMEMAGQSLKIRHVREVNRELHNAGIRHFRNWGRALRAAGIDSEKVANRRTWTVQRVLDAIGDLHRRGIALNYASALKADNGLPQAARKLLGSWNDALWAAGHDPDTLRVNRRPWTRDQIIDLIRSRGEAGLPIASYTVVPLSAEVASRRLFGSWRNALHAAGVPNPSVEFPVWTKVTVLEGILIRQMKGQPLHCYAAAHQASRLYDAARRYFGTWRNALRAADIDPQIVRRRHAPYTAEDIVAHLRRRAEEHGDFGNTFQHPESIVKAARRMFGSWKEARRVAAASG